MPGRTEKKKPPKLLVLCQLFYPELVSTGQTLTELCEALAKYGVDIEVLCAPPTVVDRKTYVPGNIEYNGIRIRRVWGTRLPKLNLPGRITNQITYFLSAAFYLLFHPDKRPVLVLTNPPFLALACGLVKILRGRRYIYVSFDVYPDTAVKLGLLKEKGVISSLWNRINGFVLRNSSDIVVIGRCMEEVLRKKVDAGTFRRIHRIHLWSDDERIRPLSREQNPFVKRWGLKEKFVLSYSGNMGRFHDLETIVKAAKELKRYKNIIFLFVGEGHKKRWALECAKRGQLDNCRFYSYVDRENLKFSLACAHVGFVSLARGQEGLSVPSKTFGLLSAGVPVIAIMSPAAEIARVVSEEKCGLIVEPGDVDGLVKAILNLYQNRELLGTMGRNARRAIDAKYNLGSAAGAYYELISRLN